jgi:transcriptional regulator with XRE-family HTH domain
MAYSASTLAMGKSKDELRDHASWLFISQGLTLTQISERIDIPIKTLSLWKKGRKGEPDWDTRKRMVLGTPTKIKETLLIEMEKLSRGEESKVNPEKLVKVASSIAKIDKKLSVEVMASVMMMYESYLAKEDPAEAVRCLPFHKKFILHLITTDGQV